MNFKQQKRDEASISLCESILIFLSVKSNAEVDPTYYVIFYIVEAY